MLQKLGCVLVMLGLAALAQPMPWGTLILPASYDQAKAYPLLIDLDNRLPERYLDTLPLEFDKLTPDKRSQAIQKYNHSLAASPEDQMAWLLEYMFPNEAAGKEFILAKISAEGIEGDYRTAEGFAKRIEGYERKVLAAYAALTTSRKIDTTRVFLTGFSIGGDLAWAITLRNPGKIRGAIVMSSRASYRQNSAYAQLQKGGARFVLSIGSSDDASRIKGIKDAAALLKGQKIASLYCEIPKATHQAAPLPVLAEALSFMLASPASQAKPATALCRAP